MVNHPTPHIPIADYIATIFTISLTITELDNILHLVLTSVMLIYWGLRGIEYIRERFFLNKTPDDKND